MPGTVKDEQTQSLPLWYTEYRGRQTCKKKKERKKIMEICIVEEAMRTKGKKQLSQPGKIRKIS